MHDDDKWQYADKEVQENLPPGVKLMQALDGHSERMSFIEWSPDGRILASSLSYDKKIQLWDVETGKCLRTITEKDQVLSVAFDPSGRILASGTGDKVKIWEPTSGKLLRTLKGHSGEIQCVAFDPSGSILASGSNDASIKIWESASGKLLHTLIGHDNRVHCVAFDPSGRILASVAADCKVNLWESASGKLLRTLEGHKSRVFCVAFDPTGSTLASGSEDASIKIWESASGKLLRTLEGHSGAVIGISYSKNWNLIASKGNCDDDTIRLWNVDNGAHIATIREPIDNYVWEANLTFHPRFPILASVSSVKVGESKFVCSIHIFKLDVETLLSQSLTLSVNYTSAKVVLLGDSGVGKTGLGWRLSHGEFKEHSSTHGQKFWLLNQLSKQRSDGAQCEAVLWDLAGQPDYRLIHALFLDDVDLSLLLFDPTRDDDPLSGVEFWLKQLKVEAQIPYNSKSTILIAARSDRGTPRLTLEELNAFCKQQGIKAYILTSAKSGDGIEELVQQMNNMIFWDDKPATITTETFKRIKDFVLGLKEDSSRMNLIMLPKDLHQRLKNTDSTWEFSETEMLTAVGHLENHGYVKWLKTSQGEKRVLLAPELINNLAASFVLEARRNLKGLGSLEEQRLLSGEYKFTELENLTEIEQDILRDSVAVLFLEHNICFREIDPLNNHTYLIFPELINLKKTLIKDDIHIEDGTAYTVSGAVENVYASLVVLMGYTQTFTRTNQWKNQARYEVGAGHVCGFRLEEERAGELDFVLYFSTKTPAPVRTLFQSLFENFLICRDLTVRRFEPILCKNGHVLNLAVVRQKMSIGAKFTFCNDCGEEIILTEADKPIRLTDKQAKEVEANRRVADNRSMFEQVLFRLKSYVTDLGITPPECFISYAWGNPQQELWVERSLAKDLRKAGIIVVLDRWENARIGASIPRFVERVGKTNRVIVVGTPLYRIKYENREPMRSFVVAAEGDIIGNRMIGSEADKNSILPVLLEGNNYSSFPILLQGKVYADFRKSEAYFVEAFKLILSIYQINSTDNVAIMLNDSLLGGRERMI